MEEQNRLEIKKIAEKLKLWSHDLLDPKDNFLKNPLVWIISILIASVIIYLRDFN